MFAQAMPPSAREVPSVYEAEGVSVCSHKIADAGAYGMLPYGIAGCIHHAHVFKRIADCGGTKAPPYRENAYNMRGVRTASRRREG